MEKLTRYGPLQEAATIEPMRKKGFAVDISVDWRKYRAVDWGQYCAIVVRTPWDYQHDPEAFADCLRYLHESLVVPKLLRIFNDVETMLWNMDKVYLAELSIDCNVPIVPTVWSCDMSLLANQQGATSGSSTMRTSDRLRRLAKRSFSDVLREAMVVFPTATEFVVKPTVSAGSDHTYRFHLCSDSDVTKCRIDLPQRTDNRPEVSDAEYLSSVFDGNGGVTCHYMIQPFLSTVLTEGEFGVFLFGGKLSHVTNKIPRNGDFRVQEQFGGLQELKESFAECPVGVGQAVQRLLRNFPKTESLLYCRIDLIRSGEGKDDFLLGELEAVEPAMYFHLCPERSGAMFADAFTTLLTKT